MFGICYNEDGDVMKLYIKGNFRRSIFHSEKGFTIGLFKVRETNDEQLEDYVGKTITFTGYFPDLNTEDNYIFYGELIEHPRYGTQYEVCEYERVLPDTKDGLIEFFSSELFPNVGEKLAKKIVDHLGESAVTSILEDVNCLSSIKGITQKKANQIAKILEEYQESESIILHLTTLGFAMREALMIYHNYKTSTIQKINDNPYQLVEDFDDITFLKVDAIRERLSISFDDERRVKACILYVMDALNYNHGNTYSTKNMILKEVNRTLGISLSEELFSYYMMQLSELGKVALLEDRYYLMNYKHI